MRKVLNLNRYSGHILNMLWDFHRAECKEESDRIYAMLELLRASGKADVKVSSSPLS
jgi:hypothetical protein